MTVLKGSRCSTCEAGIIPAKRIQLSIGADDVSAAAVNAVFIPCPSIHERFDKQAKTVVFIQLEGVQQVAERLAFAAAAREIAERVADFVAQKTLHLGEVDEVAD